MSKRSSGEKRFNAKDLHHALGSLPKNLDNKTHAIIAEACAGYLLNHMEELPKKDLKLLKKKIKKQS